MSRARILIVDAVAEQRLLYSELLADLDTELVLARSGTEALQEVQEAEFAVILLEVNMPVMDGLQTAGLIRGHANGLHTPIIFVTSYADEIQTARAYELGAVDYILSPVIPAALHNKVRVFVELYNARAALASANQALEHRVKERTLELENLSRLKDEFLATMSHELRTPLNAIFGWVTLLRTRRLDPPTQERALETIERNARAQKRLIEDLLDVSRIVSGKVALEMVPVDLQRVLRAALETMQPAADVKGVRIVLRPPGCAANVRGDFARLQQVVCNLLSNAIKFTPAGGQIELALEVSAHEAQISVTDTGQGIKPEFLPLVFERFRQQDGSINRRHGGLGLGLAIVRHLVELHAGSVEAFSAGEGKGARLAVRLPLRPASAALLEEVTGPPAASSILKGIRLLVVDDESSAREIIANMLQGYGAQVSVAENAQRALAKLFEERPHVLIADLGMPDMDGYGLIEQVRSLDPEYGGQTLAVAVTGYASPADRLRALQAGFQNHVAKPVEAQELAIVIASLVGRSVQHERL
jgi:signal transduction histidine kinase